MFRFSVPVLFAVLACVQSLGCPSASHEESDASGADATADQSMDDPLDLPSDPVDSPEEPLEEAEWAEDAVQEPSSDISGDLAVDEGTDLAQDVVEEPELDLSDTSGDMPACADMGDCPFGWDCIEEVCVERECHMGSLDLSEPDKPCPDGYMCDILCVNDDLCDLCPVEETECNEIQYVTWSCVPLSDSTPYRRVCDHNEGCPFGFLCRCEGDSPCDVRYCLHAECTGGNPYSDYGPRPCTDPDRPLCGCMEDGVDFNGGRGQCVASYEDCYN